MVSLKGMSCIPFSGGFLSIITRFILVEVLSSEHDNRLLQTDRRLCMAVATSRPKHELYSLKGLQF